MDNRKNTPDGSLPEGLSAWLHPDKKKKKILLIAGISFAAVVLLTVLIAVIASAGCRTETPPDPSSAESAPASPAESRSEDPEESESGPSEAQEPQSSSEPAAESEAETEIVFPDKPSEGLAYEDAGNGTLRLVGRGTNEDDVIVVPSEVDGKKVVSIAPGVFSGGR